MAQSAIGKAYTDLPKWAKGVVFIGGALALGIIIISVRRSIKRLAESKDLNTWAREQKDLTRKFVPSYSKAQYLTYANQVHDSVKQGVGDDYGKVVEIMKRMNNDLDVSNLVTAYDKRQLYVFGIPTGNPIDLFTTISRELGNEYGGLTSYRVSQINSDWKKKGITYTI